MGLRARFPRIPRRYLRVGFLIAYSIACYILIATVLHPVLTGLITYSLLGIPILFSLMAVPPAMILKRYVTADRLLTIEIVLSLLFVISAMAVPPVIAAQLPVKDINLPDFSTRKLPFEVARHYMTSSIGSQASLGDIDPIPSDGGFIWTGSLDPVGVQYLYAPTVGVVYQDAESLDANATVEEAHFPLTEVGLLNNVYWHITLRNPLLNPTQVIYVKRSGEWLQIVSVEGYEFEGWFFKPVWAGVFIFHTDGREEFLTPEQVSTDPRLENVPVFPESLARFYSEVWYWRSGFFSSLLFHDNQEVLDEYTSGAQVEENRQPYLVSIDGVPYWISFMKPYGAGRTLSRIVAVDATSGVIAAMNVRDKGWAGPSWAAEQVRRHRPNYVFVKDSYTSSNVRGMVVREPMPILLNGTLIWQIAITPSDASGVTEIIYIDARSGDEVMIGEEVKLPEPETLRRMSGIPEIVTEYVEHGNTRIIVRMNGTLLVARAEDLTWKEVALLHSGQNLTIGVKDGTIIEVLPSQPSG